MGVCNSSPAGFLGVWDEPKPEVDGPAQVSPILKHYQADETIPTTMATGESTVWEMVDKAFSKFSGNAVGKRSLLAREQVPSPDGKKTFEKFRLATTYTWFTYKEFGQRVEKLASSLATTMGLKKGDRVLIFAETQLDWIVCMLACFRQGATIVTAYATLGEEGVSTSLNQTGAAICICDAKLFPVVQKVAKDCPCLKFMVPIFTPADAMSPEEMQAKFEGVQVKSTDQLVDSCQAVVPAQPPAPEDVAVIMYTSGTTGASKGVMISHKNIVTQCASSLRIMPFINTSTAYLGYLPLAHIMELFIEVSMLSQGAAIGFGSPQTLTDSGVKLAAGQQGDAPLLKPTLLVFAPAVLDKVYSGVKDKVARKGGASEKLFNAALRAGYANYDQGGVGCGVGWNLLMYSAVQSLVGGKVTHIVAGSAPLSAEIQKFAQCCFNCPVRQGYGLTETIAASCVADPSDNTLEQVGPPTPGTYLRLRDWPEGGYTNADLQKEGVMQRRGEVLIGGPTVSMGYLVDEKNPDADIQKKNEEDFTTIDGVRYFCTGDVGQVNARGCLQIVDRKKDLFKGDTGEYVSLSKVEAQLKLSTYVEMSMVYGRTGAKSVIALICPKKFAIEKVAKDNSIDGTFDELCKNPVVVDAVSKDCLAKCKAGGLHGFEFPSAISLCATPTGEPAWTPDNEMLTTTMKLKRPIIAQKFVDEITDAYKRAGQ